MKFSVYDIILVDFPFSDFKASKVRPALIIKSLEGENLILCQITTKKRGISKYEVTLNKKSCNGNIKFDSNIYLDMVFTLHKSLVVNKIGSVMDEKVKREVKNKIKRIFFIE